MSHKPECYVASPSGFAESTKYWYDGVLLPMLERHVTILDPWSVDVSHILEASPQTQPESWTDLGDYHFDTIKNRAKLVVAGLDQEPPDNGTVCEVTWAAAHDVPVIGYRNDLRSAGENGLPFNLMLVAAIRRSGGLIVTNMAELDGQVEILARRV